MTKEQLLKKFVESFTKFDALYIPGGWNDIESVPIEMRAGFDDSVAARPMWKPIVVRTQRSLLDEIYRTLPGRFPSLYEELLLSYRWIDIDLDDIITLYANPSIASLRPVLEEITKDAGLTKVLFPQGLIPFGHPPKPSYDPICFSTHELRDGDCPILRIEHESVLCRGRIGDVWPIAASFEALMCEIIDRAEK
ncbi:MAG TPA: hypothetical protein VHQ47_18100 [Phycisphaerae bacterium]|nr:hypothetical protein [Phycisphaerae bacterium]